MIGRFGPRKVGESSAVGEEGNHIARLCLRLQRGCGVRAWVLTAGNGTREGAEGVNVDYALGWLLTAAK